MDNPVLSVCLITYNHVKFIRQAIEGVLMQNVNFSWELIIADDFSIDGTREILLEFKSQYSDFIKLILREKNVGAISNWLDLLSAPKSKYIAYFDGDDYWTDPNKLQKQVDFLEANPDCVLCHHWQKIAELGPDNEWIIKDAPTKGTGYYPSEKAAVKKIFTNELRVKSRSLVFRNVIKEFPKWLYKVSYGDVPLAMILGQHGDFGFINEPMAVYRVTYKGISTKGLESWLFTYNHFIEWIRIWEYGNNYYNGKYRREALKTIYYFYKKIIKKYNYSFKVFYKIVNYSLFESQLPIFLRMRIFSKLLTDFSLIKIKKIFKKNCKIGLP